MVLSFEFCHYITIKRMTIFDNLDYIENESALVWARYERESGHNHELSQWVSETSAI